MDNNIINNKTDDFFQLIAKDDPQSDVFDQESVKNPFSEDEIIFKDDAGQIKVFKKGKISNFISEEKSVKPAEPLVLKPIIKPILSAPRPTEFLPAKSTNRHERELENIIKNCQLDFADRQLKQRFENIILSRLKDIRDQIETREILLSSPQIGGMGFDDQQADKILRIINQELVNVDGVNRLPDVGQKSSSLQSQADKIFPAVQPPKLIFSTKEDKLELEKNIEENNVEVKPVEAPKIFNQPKPVSKPVLKKPVEANIEPAKPSASQKPRVEDIKFKPKSIGPIDEIESLTLADFRRFSDNPSQAVDWIFEKIEILEAESFLKKIEAIKAWKKSEIYKAYLELGRYCLEQKLPISQAIKETGENQQLALTNPEFEAISSLNSRLRY